MKNYILIISLIFMSCEESKIDFIEVNANDIKNEINKFKGEKSVLVNYWATNCSPCIDEFPMIMDLSIKYEDNLKVFFVSTDWLEDKKKGFKIFSFSKC